MVYLRNKMRRGWALLALLTLLLTAAPAWGASYFVYQQWGGTWQDANKSAANTEDDLMCWAAAASNVLTWGYWGTPTYNTTDKVFKHFQDHWTDNAGFANWGWKWWFNGSPPPTSRYSYIDVPGGGNFYPTLNYTSYFTYSMWGNFMAAVDTFMHNGYGIALTIKNGTAAHSVTAWGFDYLTTSGGTVYQSIYLTDSDDGVTALKKYGLLYKDSIWYLDGSYTGWRLTGVYGLSKKQLLGTGFQSGGGEPLLATAAVAPVPLTPTWLLLATGLLVLIGGRARRRLG